MIKLIYLFSSPLPSISWVIPANIPEESVEYCSEKRCVKVANVEADYAGNFTCNATGVENKSATLAVRSKYGMAMKDVIVLINQVSLYWFACCCYKCNVAYTQTQYVHTLCVCVHM